MVRGPLGWGRELGEPVGHTPETPCERAEPACELSGRHAVGSPNRRTDSLTQVDDLSIDQEEASGIGVLLRRRGDRGAWREEQRRA